MTTYQENSEQAADEIPIFLAAADSYGRVIASRLGLTVHGLHEAPPSWYLTTHQSRLSLQHPAYAPFWLDPESIKKKVFGSTNTGLTKAIATHKHPRVLDALGGWGVDGLTLVASGCRVTLVEVHPLIFVMARNLAHDLNLSMDLHCGDAQSYLQRTTQKFDVVYLDPFFPKHPKGALSARRMQVLASVASSNGNVDDLFLKAAKVACQRVVVKHRRNQPPIFSKPDWSIDGKTVRFDVYRSTV